LSKRKNAFRDKIDSILAEGDLADTDVLASGDGDAAGGDGGTGDALVRLVSPTTETKLDEIDIARIQSRRYAEGAGADALRSSIESRGIVQPLLLRPAGAGYEVVDGEQRLAAARSLGLQRVPAVVRNLSDDEVRHADAERAATVSAVAPEAPVAAVAKAGPTRAAAPRKRAGVAPSPRAVAKAPGLSGRAAKVAAAAAAPAAAAKKAAPAAPAKRKAVAPPKPVAKKAVAPVTPAAAAKKTAVKAAPKKAAAVPVAAAKKAAAPKKAATVPAKAAAAPRKAVAPRKAAAPKKAAAPARPKAAPPRKPSRTRAPERLPFPPRPEEPAAIEVQRPITLPEPLPTFGEPAEPAAVPAAAEATTRAGEPTPASAERTGRLAFPTPSPERALVGAGAAGGGSGTQLRDGVFLFLVLDAGFAAASFLLLNDSAIGVPSLIVLGVGVVVLVILAVARR